MVLLLMKFMLDSMPNPLGESDWLNSLVGPQGVQGEKGDDGSTAYQVYADSMQNPLNESDWLNSLYWSTRSTRCSR